MLSRLRRALALLELEERILNGASFVALVGVFLPWLSGEWLGGDPVTYSGVQFYTGLLGLAVLMLHALILSATLVPVAGGPQIFRKRYKEYIRLLTSSQATILAIAALTVLMKITFEFSRMEVRFGIYITLIGSIIATIYSFLKVQEQRRLEVQNLFHHPEDLIIPAERNESLRHNHRGQIQLLQHHKSHLP